eukprot:11643516-Alexandrium_andersonii.AAC.1
MGRFGGGRGARSLSGRGQRPSRPKAEVPMAESRSHHGREQKSPAWPLEWPPRGLTAAAQGKLRKPRARRRTCHAHAHAHIHIRARDGAQACVKLRACVSSVLVCSVRGLAVESVGTRF